MIGRLMPNSAAVVLSSQHCVLLRRCPAFMQSVSHAQVVGRGGPRGVHDRVDFWFDDGWWEVEVVASEAEPGQVVIRDQNRVVRSVPLEDLRASALWMDGTWGAVPPAGQPIARAFAPRAATRRPCCRYYCEPVVRHIACTASSRSCVCAPRAWNNSAVPQVCRYSGQKEEGCGA